jgi:site-specific DNA-methyltransferase (adenine-specific)
MADGPKRQIKRAPRNRTIELSADEMRRYSKDLDRLASVADIDPHTDSSLIHGNAFEVLDRLPEKTFDLVFADPPYNLTKTFGSEKFNRVTDDAYEQWLDSWIMKLPGVLKETGSAYICGDWRTGSAIQRIGSRYFKLQNRITWEREKGRGSKNNWKNAAEDIWFFTMSDNYFFDLEAVKIKRKVLAPYTENGTPKDWDRTHNGNFRVTHPSNLWTDITVPFWSMSENTDHPTQKPEKLLAKIILSSTRPGDIVLDPFAGSGTTTVVAKKLGRRFVAIESDEEYCLLAAKRLDLAKSDPSIQGYSDGVFWERNSGR